MESGRINAHMNGEQSPHFLTCRIRFIKHKVSEISLDCEAGKSLEISDALKGGWEVGLLEVLVQLLLKTEHMSRAPADTLNMNK